MTRKDAIQKIAATYPADSAHSSVGYLLMLSAQAKINGQNWRAESDEVLIEYARLCAKYEEAVARHPNRSGKGPGPLDVR